MDEFDDFERSDPPVEPEELAPTNRGKWAVVVVLLTVGLGVVGYVVMRRHAPPNQQPQVSESRTPPADVSLPDETVTTLPPLAETDPIVRKLVTQLSSHPKVLAWLMTNRLIENFAVVTLNISEGQNPSRHLRVLTLSGPFRVKRSGSAVHLDPRSYERYNDYASAVAGLDAAGTGRLYETLRPRIIDAYKELGHPDGDFDRVLERAIGRLTSTPLPAQDVLLNDTVGSYQFSDPAVEGLSAPQKQIIRMGPNNMRLIQAKLLEIAARLNLHLPR